MVNDTSHFPLSDDELEALLSCDGTPESVVAALKVSEAELAALRKHVDLEEEEATALEALERAARAITPRDPIHSEMRTRRHTERPAFAALLRNAGAFMDPFLIASTLLLSCLILRRAWSTPYSIAAGVAIAAYLVASSLRRLPPGIHMPLRQRAGRVLGAWSATVLSLAVLGFLTATSAQYSRPVIAVWLLATPALMVAWRSAADHLSGAIRARGYNRRRAAIAGVTPSGRRLAAQIRNAPSLGVDVIGFYDDRQTDRLQPMDDRTEVLGSFGDLIEAARGGTFDTVYIALPLRAERTIASLTVGLADSTVAANLVHDSHLFDLSRVTWSEIGDIRLVSLFETPLHGYSAALKRTQDLVLGSVILGLIALPMLLIAIAIKLTSPGPVFFRQRRHGLNGVPFNVLKFRTMHVVTEGRKVTDARITRVGAFLRRTALDELPQFLQVVTGKMSIVGPRPHAVADNEMYRQLIHGYMLRHQVKPGITGWAQVNGWKGESDTLDKMERRIRFDLDYVSKASPAFDLKILLKSIGAVLRNRSAY